MSTLKSLRNSLSPKSLITIFVLISVCVVGVAGAQSSEDDEVDFRVSENDDSSRSTLTVQVTPQQPHFLESICSEGSITGSICSIDNIEQYEYVLYDSDNKPISKGSERIPNTESISTGDLKASTEVTPEEIQGGDIRIEYTLTFESCGFINCIEVPVTKTYSPSEPLDIPNLKPNTNPISSTYSISEEQASGTADISIDGAIDPEGESLTYEIRSVEGGEFTTQSGDTLCAVGDECTQSISQSSGTDIDIQFTNNGQSLSSGVSVLGNINMAVSDPVGNSETVSVSIVRVTERDVDVILRTDKTSVEQGDSVTLQASVFGYTEDSRVLYRFSDGLGNRESYDTENSVEFTYTENPQVITPSVDVIVDGETYTDESEIELVEPTPVCIEVDSTDVSTPERLSITNENVCSSGEDIKQVSIESIEITDSGEIRPTIKTPESITDSLSTTTVDSSPIIHTFTHEPSGKQASVTYTYTEDGEDSRDDSEEPSEESPTFDAEGDIITNTQIYEVSKTYTAPHRFADGSVESNSVYEDQNVPPSRGGLGYVSEFGNIRDLSTDNVRNPAIIESDTSEGGFNTGLSYIGIPTSGDTETFNASLDITYSLQTTQTDQIVSIKVTDAYGDVIDPSATEDRTEILESTVTSEYQSDPFGALDRDSIDVSKVSVRLTEKEQQYITDNNELYVQMETKKNGVLLLYESNVVISPRTQSEDPESTQIDPEDFESENYEFDSPTFDASFSVVGSINERYGTYDYRPGDTMNIDVEIENTGDLRVTRTLGIYDYNKNTGQVKKLGVREVEIGPNSYERLSISYDWEPHEFGHHEIRVFDITDGTVSGPVQVSEEELVAQQQASQSQTQLTATESTDNDTRHQLLQSTGDDPIRTIDVYVFQPATFEVVEIIHPDNWLIYDNFDTRVVVENVGDLDGSGEFTATFDTWSDTFTIPNTAGGNVREDVTGAQQTILLDSENLDYSPSYPETPVSDSARPRSPYGSTESTLDLQVETHPNFASPVPFLYDSLTDTQSSPVRIYRMEIMTVEVEQRTTDKYTTDGNGWYASGYPYYASSSSPYWTAGGYADTQGDIIEDPEGSLPTLGGTEYLYGPLNKQQSPDEGNRRMSVRALITNNGTTDSGIARVRVVTDPGREGLSGQVVGTAGVRIDPYEYKYVNIPVVIPNNYGNDGIHNLEVQARTTPDYIRQTNPQAGFENQQDAMSIDVQINTWEDFLSQGISGQSVLNEQCEGYNPSTPDGDRVDCRTGEQQTLSMDAVWRNVGGESGTFEGNVEAVTTRDPSGYCYLGPCTGSSRYDSPGLVENYNPGAGMSTGNYWNNQQITLSPEQEGPLQADLPFTEPGVYTVQPSPHRDNNEGVLPMYEDLSTAPSGQFHTFKVLDITDPEAYISSENTRFECKSGNCDQRVNSDPLEIWEGGRIQVTGQESVDNVRITKYTWSVDNFVPNGGFDVCEGNYCYGEGKTYYGDGHGRDGIVHRFEEAGTYELTLTIEDDPAYGVGATLNSDGDPNIDTITETVVVREDTSKPNVAFSDTFTGVDKDDTSGGTPVWHRYDDLPEGLSYPGVEYCAQVSTGDDEIGVESTLWKNFNDDVTNNGEDRRCVRFNEYPNNDVISSSENDRQRIEPMRYSAWDFNQNKREFINEIEVLHDNTDPTVSNFKIEKGSTFEARLGYDRTGNQYAWSLESGDETFWWSEESNPDEVFVSTGSWEGDELLLNADTVDYGDSGEPAIGVACNLYSTTETDKMFGSCLGDDSSVTGRWTGGEASSFANVPYGDQEARGGFSNVFDRQPQTWIIRNCAINTYQDDNCFDREGPLTTGNSERVVLTQYYDYSANEWIGNPNFESIESSAVSVTAEEIGASQSSLNIESNGDRINGGYSIDGAITSTVYDWHGNNQTVEHPVSFIYDTTPPVASDASSSSPDYARSTYGDVDDDEIDRVEYFKGANCIDASDDGPNGGVGLQTDGWNWKAINDESLPDQDADGFPNKVYQGPCAFLQIRVNAPTPPTGTYYNSAAEEWREIRSYAEKTDAECKIEYFGSATYQEKRDIIDAECPDRVLTIDDFDEHQQSNSEFRYGDGGCYGVTVSSPNPKYSDGTPVPSCGGFDDDVTWNSNPPITDKHGNEVEAYAAVYGVIENEGETRRVP